MGTMRRFRKEIMSSSGRYCAFEIKFGHGAALASLFERMARGGVRDTEIREAYGFGDDPSEPEHVQMVERLARGPNITPSSKAGKYTALVSMHGVAMYDLEYQPYAFSTLRLSQIMDQLSADASIDMIVLDINTPGGHVTGTKEAGDSVWKARQKKPVIGIINPLCASAGYWIGSQCTKLIGVPSADVGSIGVFMTHMDCSAMLKDAGIKPTFIFAGEYKTEGNAMEPLSNDGQAFYQKEVDDIYADFTAAVARGRGVSVDKVIANFGKGRCYSAQMAKRVGMIDEINPIKLALHSVGLNMEPADSRRSRVEADQPDPAATANEQRADAGMDPIPAPEVIGVEAVVFYFRSDANDGDEKIYAAAPWPEKTRFSTSVIADAKPPMAVAGETITIAVENGAAVYTKVGETDSAWICALAPDSSYTEAPEPAPEPEIDAEAAQQAEDDDLRIRLALLSA